MYMIVLFLIGVIGYRLSTRNDRLDTRRILLMGIFLSVVDALFSVQDYYLLRIGMISNFPLADAIELFMSVLFLLGAIRLHKGVTASGTYGTGSVSGVWGGNDSRLGW